VNDPQNEEILKAHFHGSGVNFQFMCVSTERAMSPFGPIDEHEFGAPDNGSWGVFHNGQFLILSESAL